MSQANTMVIPYQNSVIGLVRYLMGELTEREFVVSFFLLDRVNRFGHTEEVVTRGDIQYGIYRDGKCVVAGTGYDRGDIRKVLKELRHMFHFSTGENPKIVSLNTEFWGDLLHQTKTVVKDYLSLVVDILRHLRANIGVKNTKVLLFIMERTLRYGKNEETIPMRHFVEGVKGKDGSTVQSKVGMNKGTVLRCMGELSDMGVISISKSQEYEGSKHVFLDINNLETRVQNAMLNVSKKVKIGAGQRIMVGANEARGGGKRGQGVGANEAIISNRHVSSRLVSSRQEYMPPPSAGGSIGEEKKQTIKEVVESVMDKHRITPTKEVGGKPAPLTKVSVSQTWVECLRRANADSHAKHFVHPPSQRDCSIFIHNSKGVEYPEGTGWDGLMDWAVSNWFQIVTRQFNWMKDKEPPSIPSLHFYAMFLRYFARYHQEGMYAEDRHNSMLNSRRGVGGAAMGRVSSLEEKLDRLNGENKRLKDRLRDSEGRERELQISIAKADSKARNESRRRYTEEEIDEILALGDLPPYPEPVVRLRGENHV